MYHQVQSKREAAGEGWERFIPILIYNEGTKQWVSGSVFCVCVWLSKTSVLKGCKLFGTSLEANKLFLCLNNSGCFLPGAT